MPARNYSSAAVATTLTGGITSSATTLTVSSTTGYPAAPFTIIVDSDTASEEVMEVTAVAGTTFTVTRGVDGTTAVEHGAGASVRHGVSARDFREPNTFINTPIPNGSLANSSITINGTPVSLGGTATTGDVTLTGSQTLTNKTLTSPVINGGTVSAVTLTSPEETVTVSATAATGTVNFDASTQTVLFYTTNASANFTLNVRGNSSTTLSSILPVGASITVVFLNTNGTTAYYPTAFQVDGNAVTPKWQGGTAPSAGNASSIDAYSLTIIKTAATPTYTVLASQTKFA